MDLYNAILKELKRRKVAHVEKFAPFFISSAATHVFNIVNQKKRMWLKAGEPVNTRQHIMFVAPAGFGKSTFIRQFLKWPIVSILNGTTIDVAIEGTITGESTLVGTVKKGENGETIKVPGMAYEHANAMVGFEEFSAITGIIKADYSGMLDQSLLDLLDSGDVKRRVGGEVLGYHSDMSLIGGVQPARFDLSSGLGRRLIFIVYNPIEEDFDILRKAVFAMQSSNLVDQPKMKILQTQINLRVKEIRNQLTNVIWSSELEKYLYGLHIVHYEIPLYQSLALGYWLMKLDRIGGDLVVGLDDEVKRLINLERSFRRMAKDSTLFHNIIAILKEQREREMLQLKLYEILEDLGMNIEQIRDNINQMINLGWVRPFRRDEKLWIKLTK